ncbi:kinesin-like protein KIF23, partial [Diaphorina citri]|uniref:Kinesin-like protein KIF23 n=1 Tax=Diaphorina citri TaxID=121845 RepID=A0A1S3DQ98_DIACI
MSTKPGKTPRRVNFQKSSDPLQVFCRIRPLQNAYEESCISVLSSTTIQLTPPDGSNPRYFNNKEVQYVFKKIFDTDSDQKQIYMEVAHPLVDNLIHGKDGLLLTYGVTGSGKTYTMNGGTGDKSKSTPLNNRLIREDSCQNMYVHGANEIEVTTTEEALQVLYKGQARKKMARTLCNKESSRSHSVFMIRLVQARKKMARTLCNKESSRSHSVFMIRLVQ